MTIAIRTYKAISSSDAVRLSLLRTQAREKLSLRYFCALFRRSASAMSSRGRRMFSEKGMSNPTTAKEPISNKSISKISNPILLWRQMFNLFGSEKELAIQRTGGLKRPLLRVLSWPHQNFFDSMAIHLCDLKTPWPPSELRVPLCHMLKLREHKPRE